MSFNFERIKDLIFLKSRIGKKINPSMKHVLKKTTTKKPKKPLRIKIGSGEHQNGTVPDEEHPGWQGRTGFQQWLWGLGSGLLLLLQCHLHLWIWPCFPFRLHAVHWQPGEPPGRAKKIRHAVSAWGTISFWLSSFITVLKKVPQSFHKKKQQRRSN